MEAKKGNRKEKVVVLSDSDSDVEVITPGGPSGVNRMECDTMGYDTDDVDSDPELGRPDPDDSSTFTNKRKAPGSNSGSETNPVPKRPRKSAGIGDGKKATEGNVLDKVNAKPTAESLGAKIDYDGSQRLDLQFIVDEVLHQNKPTGSFLSKPTIGLEAIVKKVQQYLGELDKLPIFFDKGIRLTKVNWKEVKDYYLEHAFTEAERMNLSTKTKNHFEEMIGRFCINEKWNNVTCAMLVKLVDAHDRSKVALLDRRILAKAQPIIQSGWPIWCLPITLPEDFKSQFPGCHGPNDAPPIQADYEACKNDEFNFNPPEVEDLTEAQPKPRLLTQKIFDVISRESSLSIALAQNPPEATELMLKPEDFDEEAEIKRLESVLPRMSYDDLDRFIAHREAQMQKRRATINSMQKQIYNMKEEMQVLHIQKEAAEAQKTERVKTDEADAKVEKALGADAKALMNDLKLKLAAAVASKAAVTVALKCFSKLLKKAANMEDPNADQMDVDTENAVGGENTVPNPLHDRSNETVPQGTLSNESCSSVMLPSAGSTLLSSSTVVEEKAEESSAGSSAQSASSVVKERAKEPSAGSSAQPASSVVEEKAKEPSAESSAQSGSSVVKEKAKESSAESSVQSGNSLLASSCKVPSGGHSAAVSKDKESVASSNKKSSSHAGGHSGKKSSGSSNKRSSSSTGEQGSKGGSKGKGSTKNSSSSTGGDTAQVTSASTSKQSGSSLGGQGTKPPLASSNKQLGSSLGEQGAKPHLASSSKKLGSSVGEHGAKPPLTSSSKKSGSSVGEGGAKPPLVSSSKQGGSSVEDQGAKAPLASSSKQGGSSVEEHGAKPPLVSSSKQGGSSVEGHGSTTPSKPLPKTIIPRRNLGMRLEGAGRAENEQTPSKDKSVPETRPATEPSGSKQASSKNLCLPPTPAKSNVSAGGASFSRLNPGKQHHVDSTRMPDVPCIDLEEETTRPASASIVQQMPHISTPRPTDDSRDYDWTALEDNKPKAMSQSERSSQRSFRLYEEKRREEQKRRLAEERARVMADIAKKQQEEEEIAKALAREEKERKERLARQDVMANWNFIGGLGPNLKNKGRPNSREGRVEPQNENENVEKTGNDGGAGQATVTEQGKNAGMGLTESMEPPSPLEPGELQNEGPDSMEMSPAFNNPDQYGNENDEGMAGSMSYRDGEPDSSTKETENRDDGGKADEVALDQAFDLSVSESEGETLQGGNEEGELFD